MTRGAMAAVALVALLFPASSAFPSAGQQQQLDPHFYDHSCPQAQQIVASIVGKAHHQDPRMAASLLRLHFHDCFVKGCDASILLDSSASVVSEKRSTPNKDSARGFEVVDEIKAALEAACPRTVSCADVLALAARDSTVMWPCIQKWREYYEVVFESKNGQHSDFTTGGPGWIVPLGRRDSLGASIQGSNNDIPAPNNTLPTIITKFKLQGLDIVDLVALLGSHTIGDSRCTSFRQRLYNQTGNGLPDSTLDPAAAAVLRPRCPRSGGDQNLFFLDHVTPFKFDNQYYKNLLLHQGLLSSDEVLFTGSPATAELVKLYAANQGIFFQHFAQSMVKMGNISPITGGNGEIRRNCRRVNHN